LTIVVGNDCLRRPECGTGPEEVGQLIGQNVQVSGSAPLPTDGHNHNFDRGSAWVLDHIIPMCKRMGLAIEGRETELLAFLASLEVYKKVRNQVDVQHEVEEVAGGRRWYLMAAILRIISWNVRGLNCPLKRGSVRWVLRRYSCDVAILLESKFGEVDRQVFT